ncbi:sugar lactone lactonase YvrE [Mycolicibacterium sp. BK634]|uniref:SMP-30/gluconolactonase/LRE family protein n=1 Tax=Mycolicibacterium sp. BK634 TaxID=2587099 RepID=UPI00160D30C2|nr:SMP-30/gluconolactonase/LRE family protein [Mycolicibacterium sp. BK634]MBB3747575.1 sugar lactone lactonase YvrE [Mycolicibacterium sp. BK634]
MPAASPFTAPVAHHGEGPFWDFRRNQLLCMDVLAGTVVAIESDGSGQRYPVPSRAATTIRRCSGSGFVIATERGVVLADDDLTVFTHFATVTKDQGVRTNDGGCDPSGAFVIGTMSYDERPGQGAVYRATPDGKVTEILAPVTISNGVQWSSDGTRVFYIDTPTRRVDVFDVDQRTGAWSGRRTHIQVDDVPGFPDGMAIDHEGGLWVAFWGGGAVNHYDAEGQFVETISVPGVSQVSSCTFGGADGTVLYITTSRQGLRADQEPNAGAVFAAQTSTRGAAQAEFALSTT